ncbi:MAG TPA: MlaD family protein [Anaeromyxobacteraceae bacterium]|nr:MlaD family protein [Anaeromyxobacteraceae bacterium]
MARQASKTLIGGFVVGAVALAVVAVTVLGSGKFFQNRQTFVMFFSGSITGLSVGSPVEFRGVKIGEVTKISAVFDPKDLSITIPVYIDFDPKSLIVAKGDQESMGGVRDLSHGNRFVHPLLDKGLKAQLEIQSLLTSQLYISVDFHPEMPTKLVGLDTRYPEIPTIPSLREQILATLQKLPDKIISATEGIEQLVRSPAAQETMRDLAVTIRDLDAFIREVRAEVKPLAASVKASSDAARRTFTQAERTLSLKEGPSAEMAASIVDTAKKAGASLDQMRSTLGSYERLASQNANVGYDLTRTLGELDAAARAVRSLADYFELHPEAVLKGRR